MTIVLYGVAIQEAIVSGDLAKMKAILKETEKHLQEFGNVPYAYEALKLEIAKVEIKAKEPPQSEPPR